MFSTNPYEHSRAASLCAACGAPDLPGVACFCVDYTLSDDVDAYCLGCGSSPGEYVATCPTCRKTGRVDSALVSFIDQVLTESPFVQPAPPDELHAEEPLPTERPRSWWPVAS